MPGPVSQRGRSRAAARGQVARGVIFLTPNFTGDFTLSNGVPDEKKGDFKLERYKFILQQINSLNESVHKYLTLYQTLATAIVGGIVLIFVSWKQLKIEASVAKAGVEGLLVLFIILTLFILVSLCAGVASWFDYRKEENEVLDDAIAKDYRKAPRLGNLWRWNETYVVLFIVAMAFAVVLYISICLVPQIH
jgi:hypothetical protein